VNIIDYCWSARYCRQGGGNRHRAHLGGDRTGRCAASRRRRAHRCYRRRPAHRRPAAGETEAGYGVHKIDLSGDPPRAEEGPHGWRIHVSAKTGEGLDALRRALLKLAGWQSGERICSWRASATSSPSSASRRLLSGPDRRCPERTLRRRTSSSAARTWLDYRGVFCG